MSKVRIINPVHQAMRFDPCNAGEIIAWLGRDFYAITNGEPVTILGVEFSTKGRLDILRNNPDNEMAAALLIFRDEINACISSIVAGDFLVKDPDLGYIVLDPDAFDMRYEFLEESGD